MKQVLGLTQEQVTPAELIRAILKRPVWICSGWAESAPTSKQADETNAEVGDRTNDGLRVNGTEVRAKVMARGAISVFMQRGRIEYSR